MQTLLQDLRYAFRTLLKAPGFTVVAILTLALGIGANTAIFSIINTVLLSPLPYHNAGRLISISAGEREKTTTGVPVSLPKFEHIQQQTQTLESAGAFYQTTLNMTGNGEPEQINANRVNHDFFHVLGVSPVLGRDFLPAEDQIGGAEVAILSDAFWHTHFNADPAVLGRWRPVAQFPFSFSAARTGHLGSARLRYSRPPSGATALRCRISFYPRAAQDRGNDGPRPKRTRLHQSELLSRISR
jgi:hypothetical protein